MSDPAPPKDDKLPPISAHRPLLFLLCGLASFHTLIITVDPLL